MKISRFERHSTQNASCIVGKKFFAHYVGTQPNRNAYCLVSFDFFPQKEVREDSHDKRVDKIQNLDGLGMLVFLYLFVEDVKRSLAALRFGSSFG